jgi:tripartite-type tricarboxylate transporter receptor subunit TctC
MSGMILVAHPTLQSARSGTVAKARSASEPLSYASSGSGGMPHLGMEMFTETAGINLLHIPYRGDGQALADVLSGRVQLMMSGYVVVLPHIRAGKLRALAVTAQQRAAIFAEVPTIVEAGYPKYALDLWTGFFAPAGTPAAVVNKLDAEIVAALSTPALQQQLATTGATAAVISPARFAAFVRDEWETYGKLVRKLKLTPE